MSGPEVVVLGAGAVGLSCAYHAAGRGASVVVVDRGQPGAGASQTNAGWVVPSMSQPVPSPHSLAQGLKWLARPGSPLAFQLSVNPGYLGFLARMVRACTPSAYRSGLAATAELNRRTRQAFDDLAADGVDFRQHRQGLLMAFLDDHAVDGYFADMDGLQAYGNPAPRLLRGEELRALEPALREDVMAGIHCPGERHVDPGDFIRALTRACEDRGVQFLLGHEVVDIESDADGRVRGVVTQHGGAVGVRAADHVVLAAGVESARIGRMVGARLPVIGGGGYGYDVPHPATRPELALYLTDHRVAVTPLPDRLRMSGAMEFTSSGQRVNNRRRALEVGRAAQHYLRDWVPDPSARPWSGLRPMTPDGLPLIGPVPGTRNMTVATGHAMLGITLAPVTGELVADSVLGGGDPAATAAFDPRRFG